MFRRFQFLWLALVFSGCGAAHSNRLDASARPFEFGYDTIAFPNELKWEYNFDAEGHWTAHKRAPKPDYSLHCFVLARTAAQFYQFAEFHPELPKTNSVAYKKLIQKLSRTNLRRPPPQATVIPGYTNLHQFSEFEESAFKTAAGGASQSYFQRGNWRMVFPFGRKHQERTCATLVQAIAAHGEALVHVVRFPKLDLNHAVLLYRAVERQGKVAFSFYDPNYPQASREMLYDRATRRFSFPATDYFRGGLVNVYQIYNEWRY